MKWTKDIFIQHAMLKHGDKYDYSKVEYIDHKTHVGIVCPIHGEFKRTPHLFLHRNIGCGPCGKSKSSNARRLGASVFIIRAQQIHENCNYDYSKVVYTNNSTKVDIICPVHGHFSIRPVDVLDNKQGCRPCGVVKSSKKRSMTKKQFVAAAQQVHGSFYEYSQSNVINSNTKVEIICPKHGSFSMLPGNHIHGEQGCQQCHCRESRMEKKISAWLTSNNIQYIKQYKSEDLKSIAYLKFDFYLPSYNLLIEYDGEQHFEPIFGKTNFERCVRHDKLKDEYAERHNIKLLRIPYTKKDVFDAVLQEALQHRD